MYSGDFALKEKNCENEWMKSEERKLFLEKKGRNLSFKDFFDEDTPRGVFDFVLSSIPSFKLFLLVWRGVCGDRGREEEDL